MKRVICLSTLVWFFLVCATARADVAPDPLDKGLTLKPNSKEKTTIAMTSEKVVITLGEKKTKTEKEYLGNDRWEEVEVPIYLTRVSAIFYLENKGPATELEVGFPSYYADELKEFTAKVDGIEVTPRLVKDGRSGAPSPPGETGKGGRPSFTGKGEEPARGGGKIAEGKGELKGQVWYTYWLVWDMEFAGNEKHTVEVSYYVETEREYDRDITSQDGGWVGLNPKGEEGKMRAVRTGYILKTGAPWNGPIGKVVVELKLTNGLTNKNLRSCNHWKPSKDNRSVRWECEKLEPSQDISITYNPEIAIEEEIKIFERLVEDKKRLQCWVGRGGWFGCYIELAKLHELSGNTEKAVTYLEKITKTLFGKLSFWRKVVDQFGARQDVQTFFEQNHSVLALLWPFSLRLLEHYRALGKDPEARSLAEKLEPKLKKWFEAIQEQKDTFRKDNKHLENIEEEVKKRFSGSYYNDTNATRLLKKVSEVLKK